MTDSEKFSNTWRSRCKYEKGIEDYKHRLQFDRKSGKRYSNHFESPSKSLEPPYKKIKTNYSSNSRYFDINSNEIFKYHRDDFENRKEGFPSRKDNFYDRKYNFETRKDIVGVERPRYCDISLNTPYYNPNNNFDGHTKSSHKVSHLDIVRGRENNQSTSGKRKNELENERKDLPKLDLAPSIEEQTNLQTMPQMLLFKHFLLQQDDNIEMEIAMIKYNEYKKSFVMKQLKIFFDAHKTQEWFREKYLPTLIEAKTVNGIKNVTSRKEIFTYLFDHQWMNTIKLNVDESSSLVNLMDALVILLEGGNLNDLKVLDYNCNPSGSLSKSNIIAGYEDHADENVDKSKIENDELLSGKRVLNEAVGRIKNGRVVEPRPLHKTFSIFLRSLHPDASHSEIEALVKPYSGYLRLALQGPKYDRDFFRQGWVTYDRTVNIKEICWSFNNVKLHGCDIGAIVNRELSHRVRPVNILTNHKSVMRQDINFVVKLITELDARNNLWQGSVGDSLNPLLKIVREYLANEDGNKEEAIESSDSSSFVTVSDSSKVTIEIDHKLMSILDKLVLYLRFVHSYDYYGNIMYESEDEMPHKLGIIHVRQSGQYSDIQLTKGELTDYIKTVDGKVNVALRAEDRLSVSEAKEIGYIDIDQAKEAFVVANTVQLDDNKWLCPLSGKKFRGQDFVRKHIFNKHMDKVDEVVEMATFFNNYLLDPMRPKLPEASPVSVVEESADDCVITGESRRDVGGADRYGKLGYGGHCDMRDVLSVCGAGGRGWQGNGGAGLGTFNTRRMMSYRDLDLPSYT